MLKKLQTVQANDESTKYKTAEVLGSNGSFGQVRQTPPILP